MASDPKPLTRRKNSGSGHSYLLDGEECPGVTTILDRGVPKPGLIGWASGTVADFVVNRLGIARNEKGEIRIVADELVADALAWNETRDGWRRVKVSNDPLPRLALAEILRNIRYKDSGDAAVRGTAVHGYAARLMAGESVLVPKEYEAHVLQYVEFLKDWQPYDAIVEGTIVNRQWRYMGSFDIIASFPGAWSAGPLEGTPVGTGLIDIKTSRTGIFAETALQLEGYRHGEALVWPDGTEEPMPQVDWVGALHVRADGYGLRVASTDDLTYRTFLYIKQVGDWLERDNGPAATVFSDELPPPTITESDTP